jgi:YD repeat-containing protein
LSELENYTGYNYFYSIIYSDNLAYTNTKLLTSSTITDFYNNGDQITSVKSFSYDSDHLLLTSKTENLSKGSYVNTRFKYPFNYSPMEPYLTMVNRHILSPVIETSEYLGESTPLQSIKTNYLTWGSNIIAPGSVETTTGTSSLDVRINYYSYDNKGNVTDVAKINDIHTAYIWGYNEKYPVAKIANKTYSEISGNSTLMNALNQLQNYSDLSDGTVRENLKILNTNIRNLLTDNVMITTYTYMPLIGMTSSTDENGITTYYEYDSFGRLKLIKRDDGKVLKAYDYHYKQ